MGRAYWRLALTLSASNGTIVPTMTHATTTNLLLT
jgi:hypothetical protein